jgi:hypothetical protein
VFWLEMVFMSLYEKRESLWWPDRLLLWPFLLYRETTPDKLEVRVESQSLLDPVSGLENDAIRRSQVLFLIGLDTYSDRRSYLFELISEY